VKGQFQGEICWKRKQDQEGEATSRVSKILKRIDNGKEQGNAFMIPKAVKGIKRGVRHRSAIDFKQLLTTLWN